MADKKISALTASTTPLAGTEVLPIVQGGSTVKVSVADLTAGRTVSASVLGVGTASPLTTLNVEGGTFLLRGGPMDIGPTSGATGAARISSSLTNGVEGKLIFSTSNSSAAITEAMNIDKDGNVTNTIGNLVIGTTAKGLTTGSSIPLGFGVNNAVTAMTIDTSSNLIVGGTSQLLSANASRLEVQAPVDKHGTTSVVESVGFVPFIAWNRAAGGDNNFAAFGTEASYTGRGGISYNRAGGLVVYATTSDYRAKEVFGPVENSGATIDNLKIYMGKMHGATETRPMLIAHEAQEVAPYAVTGTKDAVNEDGSPEYQQIDVSTLVPLLIAEVQSLRARVAQLEGK